MTYCWACLYCPGLSSEQSPLFIVLRSYVSQSRNPPSPHNNTHTHKDTQTFKSRCEIFCMEMVVGGHPMSNPCSNLLGKFFPRREDQYVMFLYHLREIRIQRGWARAIKLMRQIISLQVSQWGIDHGGHYHCIALCLYCEAKHYSLFHPVSPLTVESVVYESSPDHSIHPLYHHIIVLCLCIAFWKYKKESFE